MLTIPNMLLIGSLERNSGKTTLVTKFIEKYKKNNKIVAIKITTSHKDDKNELFEIQKISKKDIDPTNKNKDTSRFLLSGADSIFWIKTEKHGLKEAFNTLIDRIDQNAVIICESNSLRKIVRPGIFLMMKKKIQSSTRQSAMDVLHLADITITFDETQLNVDLDRIRIENGKWVMRQHDSGNR